MSYLSAAPLDLARQRQVELMIDFVLKESHKKLVKALDQAIAEDEQDGGGYSNPVHLLAAVGAFVDALGQVPGGSAELNRRASLIESMCAQWPEYRRAAADTAGYPRAESADSPEVADGAKTAEEAEAARKAFATAADAESEWFDTRSVKKNVRRVVKRLMRYAPLPCFRADVDRNVADIELVLEELALDAAAQQAFKDWLVACFSAQHTSNGLAVDGCWHMLRLAMERAQNLAKRDIGARMFDACWLRDIRRAASSLKKWAKNQGDPSSPPMNGQGGPQEASAESVAPAAAPGQTAGELQGEGEASAQSMAPGEMQLKGTSEAGVAAVARKHGRPPTKLEHLAEMILDPANRDLSHEELAKACNKRFSQRALVDAKAVKNKRHRMKRDAK